MEDLHLAVQIESANYRAPWPENPPQVRIVPIGWRQIIQAVADKHRITVADLTGQSLIWPHTRPRFEACYDLARLTTFSLPQIGARLGGRDHTTILNGIRRHCELNGLPHPRPRA